MYSSKRRIRLFRIISNDAILASLTTSAALYNAASVNSWVKVTQAEYVSLQTKIVNTSTAGTTNAMYSSIGTTTGWGTSAAFLANFVNASQPGIAANGYVYAVSLYTSSATSGIQMWAKSDTNGNIRSGFRQLGNTLPTTTVGNNYYVLKSPSALTTGANGGTLGCLISNMSPLAYGRPVGSIGCMLAYTSTANSSTSLDFSSADTFAIQALVTTSKQW